MTALNNTKVYWGVAFFKKTLHNQVLMIKVQVTKTFIFKQTFVFVSTTTSQMYDIDYKVSIIKEIFLCFNEE